MKRPKMGLTHEKILESSLTKQNYIRVPNPKHMDPIRVESYIRLPDDTVLIPPTLRTICPRSLDPFFI